MKKKATDDAKIESVRKIFSQVKIKLKEYPTGELWIQFMEFS